VPYRDALSARLGGELTIALAEKRALLRAGYGFESSPIPARQPGVTNLLDGPKHTLAVGAGLALPRGGATATGTLRIDVHAQAQIVGERRLDKVITEPDAPYDPFAGLRDEEPDVTGTQISNPGYPSLRSGGQLLSAGVTLEVGF
jgi:hypothetical protein